MCSLQVNRQQMDEHNTQKCSLSATSVLKHKCNMQDLIVDSKYTYIRMHI